MQGGQGRSCSINLETGKWADFSNGEARGNDLVSLYAAVRGLSQGEAAKLLNKEYGKPNGHAPSGNGAAAAAPPVQQKQAVLVPDHAPACIFTHPSYGEPSATWTYRDAQHRILHHVARYDVDGKKHYCPFVWDGKRWQKHHWQEPRPLYGLDDLAMRPDAPFLLCYSPDTELLTLNGWKPISECGDGDIVAQYDSGNESICFTAPTAWQRFHFKGHLLHFVSDWCDTLVTPDHRMLTRYWNGRHKSLTVPTVRPAEGLHINHYLPVSGYLSVTDSEGPTLDEARLLAAYQADGHRPPKNPHVVTFNLKKQRKIERIRELLTTLAIPWEERTYPSTPGWTHLYFHIHNASFLDQFLPDKKFTWNMLLWNTDVRLAILEEMSLWDGDAGSDTASRFFTADRINADVLSALAVCTGYGSILRTQDRTDIRPRNHLEYVLNLKQRTWRSFGHFPYELEPYSGPVYCCTVPTGFLVTRRNGKTTIAGNCEGEKAADAARKLTSRYVVVTWSGGANSWHKADLSPLFGRQGVLWPDHDAPGRAAILGIIRLLSPHCPELRALTPPADKPEGWDAADALAEGWTTETLRQWATSHSQNALALIPKAGDPPATNGNRLSLHSTLNYQALWLKWELDCKNGNPIANVANAYAVLHHCPDLQNLCWYDEFLGCILTGNPPRKWIDDDDIQLQVFMQHELGISHLADSHISRALLRFARAHTRNSVKDWLTSLQWDQTSRIDHFFGTHFTAQGPTSYIQAVSRNFWISMSARVMNPGCQVDNMVVLEGGQGSGKSRAVRTIGGLWFAEQHESASNPKAFAENLQGKLLVEIAEMDAFSRSEITRVKATISNTSDRYRGAYDRYASDHPRQGIFVGTTNKDDWNKDETGARRFWPIACQGEIDIPAIRAERDQLFAEAAHAYLSVSATAFEEDRVEVRADWWTTPADITTDEQRKRLDPDVWVDEISDWLKQNPGITTSSVREVLKEALKISPDDMGKLEQMRAGAALARLGWRRTLRRLDGRPTRVWDRPE